MIYYLVCDECGWESAPKISDKNKQAYCSSCHRKFKIRKVTDEEIAEKEGELARVGFFLEPCLDGIYDGEDGFSLVSKRTSRKVAFGAPLEWAVEMSYNDVFVHDAYGLGHAVLAKPEKDK